ncbi:MAG: hypothetical protein ACRDC4_01680, partial [Plesiomonas sp.]
MSKQKMQFCLPQVNYLGHVLSKGQKVLSPERIKIIVDTKRPATKHALMAFLGLINYCRQWIPDCSYHDRTLRGALTHDDPMTGPLAWTQPMLQSYEALKAALCSAPALGLPNYALPFHLYVT